MNGYECPLCHGFWSRYDLALKCQHRGQSQSITNKGESMSEKTKKYNPTAGSAFGHDAFGKGAIKLDITQEGFDAIMKNLQVGGSILLKYNTVTKRGNTHYFTEILPPFKPDPNYKKKEATEGSALD